MGKAFTASWFLSPNGEMAKQLAVNLSDNGQVDSSKYPEAKAAGYSMPRCVYCPRADYSPQATEGRVQGTVELVAVIGEDGLIKNLRVVKGLPGGLTLEAIKAVERWRLQPATGPDGKPVAVRVPIQVSFQLF